MADNNEFRLFSGDSLVGYLNAKLASVTSLAERITRDEFLAASAAALGQPILGQLSVAPLALQMEQMQRKQNDIEVAKVRDTRDYGNVVKREVMVRGYMMLYLIPFTGDAALWLLSNGPRMEPRGGRDALDAEQRILTLTLYNSYDVEPEWYQRQMENTMAEIDRHLDGQAYKLKQYHLDLAEAVARAVARRGQQLQASGA